MTTSSCAYSEPVDLNPLGQPQYAFSILNCTSSDPTYLTLIKNESTGAEFYLNKSLDYGEALILWFLTIFSIVFIFRIAYNFFWKK